jgi:hypothetical protein
MTSKVFAIDIYNADESVEKALRNFTYNIILDLYPIIKLVIVRSPCYPLHKILHGMVWFDEKKTLFFVEEMFETIGIFLLHSRVITLCSGVEDVEENYCLIKCYGGYKKEL